MFGAEGSVLMDGERVILVADDLDHVEIVGPLAKFCFCTIHMTAGGEERREAGMLVIPWEVLPGGVNAIQQAWGDRVWPRRPAMVS